MANKKGFYYLIEDLDIDGDYNSDGFIITKYKINQKTNDKIFIKTKYVTFENFKKIMQKNNKHGGNIFKNGLFPTKIHDMVPQGYQGGYRRGYPQGYPQGYQQGYPQGYPPHNIGYTNGTNFMNNQNPDRITIASDKPAFFDHVKAGFGTGLGWAAADNIVDSVFNAVF